MEAAGTEGSRAYGKGKIKGIIPGYTFKLEGHPQVKANQEYLVVQAQIEVQEREQSSGDHEYTYYTQFEVIPTSKIYRISTPVKNPKTLFLSNYRT